MGRKDVLVCSGDRKEETVWCALGSEGKKTFRCASGKGEKRCFDMYRGIEGTDVLMRTEQWGDKRSRCVQGKEGEIRLDVHWEMKGKYVLMCTGAWKEKRLWCTLGNGRKSCFDGLWGMVRKAIGNRMKRGLDKHLTMVRKDVLICTWESKEETFWWLLGYDTNFF